MDYLKIAAHIFRYFSVDVFDVYPMSNLNLYMYSIISDYLKILSYVKFQDIKSISTFSHDLNNRNCRYLSTL